MQLYPELITETTAELSQWATTEECCHTEPHIVQANTIGSNSWTTILAFFNATHFPQHSSGHSNWNHLPDDSHTAPQPTVVDTSVHISNKDFPELCGQKIETPFQEEIKVAHHSISDQVSLLSRTWCALRAPESSPNKRPMKVLPGCTTQLACAKCPTMDSSSFLVHDFLDIHDERETCKLASLAAGRHTSPATVSISKLKKVRLVV